jgi:hypothetical protein
MAKKHNTDQVFNYFNKRNIPNTPEKLIESINKSVKVITDKNSPNHELTFETNALIDPIYKTITKLWLDETTFKNENYFIRVHMDRMFDYMSIFLYNHLDDNMVDKPDPEDRKKVKAFERKRDDIITQFEKAFK